MATAPIAPSISVRIARTLKLVAAVPFATALDYAAFERLLPDRIRERLRKLHELALVDFEAFGTPTLRSERRWWVTTSGFRLLLEHAETDAERDSIRRDWAGLGVMARRADVAALITRVIAGLAPHIPDPSPVVVRFHYLNSGPIDCVVELTGNRFITIVYAGPLLRRRSVWNRLNRLTELTMAANYPLLVLTPTIFDRTAILDQVGALGLNGLAATVTTALDARLNQWLSPDQEDWFGYKTVAEERMMARYFTADKSAVRVDHLKLPLLEPRTTPVRNIRRSPALRLSPLAKRMLDVMAHWLTLNRNTAIDLLDVSGPQLSDILRSLRALELVTTEQKGGSTSYSLSDTGISYLSARDRCDVAAMLDLLSVSRLWDLPQDATYKQTVASYRGGLIRSFLKNRDHDSLVSECLGYLTTELAANSSWRVLDHLPPRRSRISVTPGRRIKTLRPALRSWRTLSTKRKDIGQDRGIVVFPDALVHIETGDTTLRIILEVELTATTRGEWQDRLESHVMLALLRYPDQVTLFVVGSDESEQTVLQAQTRWVQAGRGRSWPVATTTVEKIRERPVTDPIWRVDVRETKCRSLLELPEVMNGDKAGS